MKKNQRRERLIKPRLQLKIVFMFLVVSVLAVGIQSVLMSRSMSNMGLGGGDSQAMYSLLRENLMVTLAALLPATLIVGVITTFRIAGPLFRFERFLEAIERGESPPDCEIRRSDDLHDFCCTLNRVSRPWRVPTVEPLELDRKHDVDEVPGLVDDSVVSASSRES